MEKGERITFRLSPGARERLARVCKLTGLDEPTALRACIEAFVEHVEDTGEIRLPLAIVAKSKLPKSAPTQHGESAGAPDSASTRFSVNEEPRETKPTGPRARSARAGIQKIVGREKGKN